jgi:hypothetical protein
MPDQRCEITTTHAGARRQKSTLQTTIISQLFRALRFPALVPRPSTVRASHFPPSLRSASPTDFSQHAPPYAAARFSPAFSTHFIWRRTTREYNSGRCNRRCTPMNADRVVRGSPDPAFVVACGLALPYPKILNVSRNRVLLSRAVEEAEGYLELGMMEHALRTLQRRGALVHGNGRACYMLGEALRELARYEEALMPLERSADLLPDDIHVLMALGWCYKRTGQLGKAIDALERAVKIDPSEAVLHYNLACYWSLARNRTSALKYLSRALEIDSNVRDLIADETDFNPLRDDPEFQTLAGIVV